MGVRGAGDLKRVATRLIFMFCAQYIRGELHWFGTCGVSETGRYRLVMWSGKWKRKG